MTILVTVDAEGRFLIVRDRVFDSLNQSPYFGCPVSGRLKASYAP